MDRFTEKLSFKSVWSSAEEQVAWRCILCHKICTEVNEIIAHMHSQEHTNKVFLYEGHAARVTATSKTMNMVGYNSLFGSYFVIFWHNN